VSSILVNTPLLARLDCSTVRFSISNHSRIHYGDGICIDHRGWTVLRAQKEIENQQRSKKIEVYENFLEKWFDKLFEARQNGSADVLNDKEFLEFLTEFTRKLILWGSDDVVKSY